MDSGAADGGDACEEGDSAQITTRYAQLRAFERRHYSNRVSQALLKSPLTLTLADMIALVTNTDFVEVPFKLRKVLEAKSEFSASGNVPPTAQLAAFQTVLTELAPNNDSIQELSNFLQLTRPTWAAVVQTPAWWEQCSGPDVF